LQENKELFRELITKKIIYIPLILTAICAYGFYVTNYSIGVDDTALARYYVDGYAPAVGRYTLYLLNFVLKMSEFSPFILEFVNVVVLVLAAIVWMVLIKKIAREQIHIALYSVFGCLFISFPLFNEIFVYYFHGSPGMGMGYLFTAISALNIYTFLLDKKINNLIYATIMFYFALGIYESFTLVYIMACAAIFFLINIYQKEKFTLCRFFVWIGLFVLPIIIGIIFRSVTCNIIVYFTEFDNTMRSVTSSNWLFAEDWKLQYEILKDEFMVKYVLNAIYYIPLRNYLISAILLFLYSIAQIIYKRNGWIAIGSLGILISPILIVPIEGVITPYRANLGLAFSLAMTGLVIGNSIYKRIKYNWIVLLLFSIIIFNQAFNLNHWFYLEDVKYKQQVELTTQLYYDLAKDYDLNRKVLVIGELGLPDTLKEHTHIAYDDNRFKYITLFEEKFDLEISKKYFDEYGYMYTEIPDLYLYSWGQGAFDDGSLELSHFFEMHGYKLTPGSQGEWQEAQFLTQDGPCYPEEGYITEYNDYIIVKLADYMY
jgi:hypothetical protein